MDENRTFAEATIREADQYDELALDLAGLALFIDNEPHPPQEDDEVSYLTAICAVLAGDAIDASVHLRHVAASHRFVAGS